MPALATVGGGKAIVDWLQKRWETKEQHRYNKELETLKAEYTRATETLKGQMTMNQSIMNTALSHLNGFTQSFNEKREKAIDEMWSVIMELKEIHSGVVFLDNTTPPETYEIALERESFNKTIDDLSHKVGGSVMEKARVVEKSRIYLGENIWWLFYIYSAFIQQTMFTIVWQAKFAEKITGWATDNKSQNILKEVLNENEFKKLDWGSNGAISRAQMSLENKIGLEVSKIFSGEKAAELGFETAQRYAKVVQNSLLASDTEQKS